MNFISKKDAEIFMNLNEKQMKINKYNSNLLTLLDKNISISIRDNILSKYYIKGYGSVYRFSELHKRIDYYFHKARTTPFNIFDWWYNR